MMVSRKVWKEVEIHPSDGKKRVARVLSSAGRTLYIPHQIRMIWYV